MDLNWDDDDFDVEAVLASHSAKAQQRSELRSQAHLDLETWTEGNDHHGSKIPGAGWLRSAHLELPRIQLPKHLSEVPSRTPASKFIKCGYAHLDTLALDLVDSFRAAFSHGFDFARMEAMCDRSAICSVSATSLAAFELVTPSKSAALIADAMCHCASLTSEWLSNILSLHPELQSVLGGLVGGLTGSKLNGNQIFRTSLELLRLRPLKGHIPITEQYLCHSHVEAGLLTLIVPLGLSAEIHVGCTTCPSVEWTTYRLSGICAGTAASTGRSGASGLLLTGRTLEKLAGVPAAPWCLMTSGAAGGDAQAPVSVAVFRLCPIASLSEAGRPSLGAPWEAALRLVPAVPESHTIDERLSNDVLLMVLRNLSLRATLLTAAVSRAFASGKLLTSRLAMERVEPADVGRLLKSARLLRGVEVLDLSSLASCPRPPCAELRAAVLAAPRLHTLRLPHWPGIVQSLHRLRSSLSIRVEPLPTALADKLARAGARMDIHLTVHGFFSLFPTSLEELPEWRRPQVSRLFAGLPGPLEAWLRAGARRPPSLALHCLDPCAPLADVARAAAARLRGEARSGDPEAEVALYFCGERLDASFSALDAGLLPALLGEPRSCAGLPVLELDAVL